MDLTLLPEEVLEPRETDILLGRGGYGHKWSGNRMLRRFARRYAYVYKSSTSKKQKTELSVALLQEVEQAGGRFLERRDYPGLGSAKSWKLQHHFSKKREKCSQALRDAVLDLSEEQLQPIPIDHEQEIGHDCRIAAGPNFLDISLSNPVYGAPPVGNRMMLTEHNYEHSFCSGFVAWGQQDEWQSPFISEPTGSDRIPLEPTPIGLDVWEEQDEWQSPFIL